jgi:hypothetical protein
MTYKFNVTVPVAVFEVEKFGVTRCGAVWCTSNTKFDQNIPIQEFAVSGRVCISS